MIKSFFIFISILIFSPSLGQMDFSSTAFDEVSNEKARDEFLVNTRMFQFSRDHVEPWIEGITHLRSYGVDFSKPKDENGLYQYVDEERVEEYISFCKEKKLKVIWTLNVSSFTLEQEMKFVEDLINRGLNIVGFEYGGEFYLKKYYFGNLEGKGVVEKIRMDGDNRDYLDLLEMWLPPMVEKYPMSEYQHILITAFHGKTQTRQDIYRREFNAKIYDWVRSRPEYYRKVDFSYHAYTGTRPEWYNPDEARIMTGVDWDFLNLIPEGSKWVCTESGFYIADYSEEELAKARKFLTDQSEALGDKGLMGIHTLFIPVKRMDPLAMYNLNGMTPVGENFKYWFNNTSPPEQTQGSDNSEENPSESDLPNHSQPTLVDITPEYGGFWDFIHFSHTLTFSNGKSYKRSYWFSRPKFTKEDIGKPFSYFKKKAKN